MDLSFLNGGHLLTIFVGVLFLMVFSVLTRDISNLKIWQCILQLIILFIIGYFGALLLYFIENDFTFGGTRLFGTIALLIPVPYFMYKIFNYNRLEQAYDFLGVAVPFIFMLIRIDCLKTGCCYGIESVWGMSFDHSPGVYRVPIQLFELIGCGLIFLTLTFLYLFKNADGFLFPIFLISYGVLRFITQTLRVRYNIIGWLSVPHIYSVCSIIIGIIVIILLLKRNKYYLTSINASN